MADNQSSGSTSPAHSPTMKPFSASSKVDSAIDLESGYASASSSTSILPQISLTKAHLKHLNEQLEHMAPIDILRLCKVFFPNLYQSTAFGLTGLVTLDMLSRIQAESPSSQPVDAIFLDTLYHFPETYDLVERAKARYPNVRLHIYRPDGVDTADQFAARYGDRLWETDSELYDWVAKVEPQQRSYLELGVGAVLTGRRRSQGGERGKMGVVEVDEERGIVKINPLVNWSFDQVRSYIREHDVPYNALLDRGYKSVGDWHSTAPVAEGEDERSGRWKGQQKTECGIHNKKSRYAIYLEEMAKQEEQRLLQEALSKAQAAGPAEGELSVAPATISV